MTIYKEMARYPTLLFLNKGEAPTGLYASASGEALLRRDAFSLGAVPAAPMRELAKSGIGEVITVTELQKPATIMSRGIWPFRRKVTTLARPITMPEIMGDSASDKDVGAVSYTYDAVTRNRRADSLSLRWFVPMNLSFFVDEALEHNPLMVRDYLRWLVTKAGILKPEIDDPEVVLPRYERYSARGLTKIKIEHIIEGNIESSYRPIAAD